jgi:hypothetical protein
MMKPFILPTFWGRQKELQAICNYLLAEPPQSCAIIGETFMGKTTLLRALNDLNGPQLLNDLNVHNALTFVYLDCNSYLASAHLGEYTSAQFWWDLYNEMQVALNLNRQSKASKQQINERKSPIDTAFEIKSEIVEILRGMKHPVVFLFDNFEGVAHLPLHNSEWLRSMSQLQCAYVVSSRHLLYLLYQYHPERIVNPSPLWNIFTEPIYLGLMAEKEVDEYLNEAKREADRLGSHWTQEDISFLLNRIGRHPELLRIACSRLFEQRLQAGRSIGADFYEFLDFSIAKEASPICSYLWLGLADPELSGEPRTDIDVKEKGDQVLSAYQRALIDIAKGSFAIGKRTLFVLEERGLIERVDGTWRVFGEIMRQYALKQERASTPEEQVAIKGVLSVQSNMQAKAFARQSAQENTSSIMMDVYKKGKEIPAFTPLEGGVYNYLIAHAGTVCSREQIKSSVWGLHTPGDSALQKVIERIRQKIEPDPDHPRYLLAVRGQGFMLREDAIGTADKSKGIGEGGLM